ncbi:hypothetical protein Taro_007708 [Colocasia esculenta]|uniref:Uncharacterized protein n=1 Tax=Colocasia esculenta TaxID=4460 RepID=A0A843TUY3_COLES|nr:hypothetical protein [Colocasia esculenta]
MWCVPCVFTDCGLVSLARLRPVRGRRTRIKYVIGLTDLAEAFRHIGDSNITSWPLGSEFNGSGVVLLANAGSLSLGGGSRVSCGCCEQEIWTHIAHKFSGEEGDGVGRHVLNATASHVTFFEPPF